MDPDDDSGLIRGVNRLFALVVVVACTDAPSGSVDAPSGSVDAPISATCVGKTDVVLCTIQGGGHQWSGGDTLPFLGTKSDNLITTDALWTFFMAHPRAP